MADDQPSRTPPALPEGRSGSTAADREPEWMRRFGFGSNDHVPTSSAASPQMPGTVVPSNRTGSPQGLQVMPSTGSGTQEAPDISSIQHRLASIPAQQAHAHTARTDRHNPLQEALGGYQTRIQTLKDGIQTLKDEIQTLKDEMQTLTADAAELRTRVNSLEQQQQQQRREELPGVSRQYSLRSSQQGSKDTTSDTEVTNPKKRRRTEQVSESSIHDG